MGQQHFSRKEKVAVRKTASLADLALNYVFNFLYPEYFYKGMLFSESEYNYVIHLALLAVRPHVVVAVAPAAHPLARPVQNDNRLLILLFNQY